MSFSGLFGVICLALAGVEGSIDRRTSSASYSYDEEGDHAGVHRSSGICRLIPDPRPPAAF
jgi:hypothetical protein